MAAPTLASQERVSPGNRSDPCIPDVGHWRGFARQLGLIVAGVLLYFGARGLTEGNVGDAMKNGLDVLAFEERTGMAIERGAQSLVLDHQWLVTVANWIYIWGHWPAIALVLVWLHRTNPLHFLRLRNAMFISGAIGLVIFVLYPVAPPRLLDRGFLDTVSEFSKSYRVLQPPSLVNKYAALPSLHVGWNLLLGVSLVQASHRTTLRIIGVVSPILMAFAVVVTANHYVIDAVIGATLALVGWWVSLMITPWLAKCRGKLPQQVVVVDDQPVDAPIG